MMVRQYLDKQLNADEINKTTKLTITLDGRAVYEGTVEGGMRTAAGDLDFVDVAGKGIEGNYISVRAKWPRY